MTTIHSYTNDQPVLDIPTARGICDVLVPPL